MELKPGLTKEAFWDKMKSTYPEAFKKFSEWVDEYKKAIGWPVLFGEITRPDYHFSAPKFHDLPLSMQMGIWWEYCFQQNEWAGMSNNPYYFDLSKDVEDWFIAEEVFYSNQKP